MSSSKKCPWTDKAQALNVWEDGSKEFRIGGQRHLETGRRAFVLVRGLFLLLFGGPHQVHWVERRIE